MDDPVAPSLVEGRYERGELIGRGGMAEVFAGRDARLGRDVALKFLRADLCQTAGLRTRFEAEARLAAKLNHPHVVAVFDTGEQDGRPFIVMECLAGATLHDRIAEGPLAADEVLDVAAQLLDALGAAHACGVVHRDVKPSNALLDDRGGWKLADFGIAKALDDLPTDLTTTTGAWGTPEYLPPERFGGEPATAQGDLYALAVVLIEASSGQNPFRADSPAAVVGRIVSPERPDVDELCRTLPPEARSGLRRALSVDPAERFESAAAMAEWMGLAVGARVAAEPPSAAQDALAGTVSLSGDATRAIGVPLATPHATATRPLHAATATRALHAPLPTWRDSVRQLRWPTGRSAAALALAGVVAVVVLIALVAALHHPASPGPAAAKAAGTSPPATVAPLPGGLAGVLDQLQREVKP